MTGATAGGFTAGLLASPDPVAAVRRVNLLGAVAVGVGISFRVSLNARAFPFSGRVGANNSYFHELCYNSYGQLTNRGYWGGTGAVSY